MASRRPSAPRRGWTSRGPRPACDGSPWFAGLLWSALLAIVVLWGLAWFLNYGALPGPDALAQTRAQMRGPLDPGVVVRDHGSGRSKCISCEDDAGEAGGKPHCLTCTQPSFRYLDETIIAERGAAENGACHTCRGRP